eukprot:Protomagalhaensia_sp_Gyna_25__1649@NODE_1856_length_1469_cov_12_146154_g1525_i0_p1_GENE_NODE_1856_length_1469_cov_12_146154_g1525_i0NODE_1856_length_1469_cov_12_146154_g1525_i0_p1_ORF_typecomplete_len424_score23_88_NODE_1856_length_1469_cov_12_146154_g1525_i0611332
MSSLPQQLTLEEEDEEDSFPSKSTTSSRSLLRRRQTNLVRAVVPRIQIASNEGLLLSASDSVRTDEASLLGPWEPAIYPLSTGSIGDDSEEEVLLPTKSLDLPSTPSSTRAGSPVAPYPSQPGASEWRRRSRSSLPALAPSKSASDLSGYLVSGITSPFGSSGFTLPQQAPRELEPMKSGEDDLGLSPTSPRCRSKTLPSMTERQKARHLFIEEDSPDSLDLVRSIIGIVRPKPFLHKQRWLRHVGIENPRWATGEHASCETTTLSGAESSQYIPARSGFLNSSAATDTLFDLSSTGLYSQRQSRRQLGDQVTADRCSQHIQVCVPCELLAIRAALQQSESSLKTFSPFSSARTCEARDSSGPMRRMQLFNGYIPPASLVTTSEGALETERSGRRTSNERRRRGFSPFNCLRSIVPWRTCFFS